MVASNPCASASSSPRTGAQRLDIPGLNCIPTGKTKCALWTVDVALHSGHDSAAHSR
jgi:hypothetical protein